MPEIDRAGAYSAVVQFVVHYAELGLKGRNRPRFERFLRENLERRLSPLRPQRVKSLYGRILVELPDDVDIELAQQRLAQVFGVAYASRATVCDPDLASIEHAVDAFVDSHEFSSFGIKARRSEKSHPFTSSDLAQRLGARVAKSSGARVDLSDPELWIEIHVLTQQAILLHGRVPGPGGIPTGSSGRALSLISGGIDSPVACYEMLKRGLALSFIHFHSSPFTNAASQEKVRDLVAKLAIYQRTSKLYLVPFGEAQHALVKNAPAEPRIVLYRRMMIRIAETIATSEGAGALITGESLGQVSSQTLGNLDTINRVAEMPILRPLIGRDKAEIIERARQMGTFEISIEPDEDCCSFLMPRNPATRTRPWQIEKIEAGLDVSGLVSDTVARMSCETIPPIP